MGMCGMLLLAMCAPEAHAPCGFPRFLGTPSSTWSKASLIAGGESATSGRICWPVRGDARTRQRPMSSSGLICSMR
eukprot:15450135-Alexandrium_andersonii.AAC.1